MSEKLTLHSSWFCPFAQRVWMGLLEAGIDFDLVEVDPYAKTTEWLQISPRGLVPVIRHQGQSIYESSICLEYIDDICTNPSRKLLPGTAYERARQRIWGDHISKRIVPPFYKYLMQGSDSARLSMLAAVEDLVEAMDPATPFFLSDRPTFVDLMLAPFALRFDSILGHYRGFKIPEERNWDRYRRWLGAAESLDSTKATLPEVQKLQGIYKRYADNTAKSEVADAVRSGTDLP